MRFKFIRLIFLLMLSAVVLRLFYWQVVKAEQLTAQAESQHYTSQIVQGLRGSILFSDKSVLATTQPTFTLYGLPKTLNDIEKSTLEASLAKVFWGNLPQNEQLPQQYQSIKQDFADQLSKDLYWVPLEKNVTFDLKQKIDEMNLNGIGFDQTSNRFYPEGSSSAHLLGFVADDAKGEKTGYFGVEGYYDGELKGVSGLLRQEKDALGLPILLGNFFGNEARDGKTLVLNIDRTIQYIVEQNLKEGVEKYGAKAGSAVVMDPKTGAILALAAYPNYNPADFGNYPKNYYKDPVVADQYEPGSTFKVLVMAAAINEGLVKPDTKCDICSGPVQIGGFTIRTWDNKYFPDSTMTDVIVHSDNTGMVFTGKKLGLDRFYSYLEEFGFGKSTNVDLQDEFSPDLRPKKDWREIDLATASFGQGIAVTAIQMVRAVAAIANGGYLMEPHVVKDIKGENSDFEIKPRIIRQVISDSTAKTMTEMMVKAVDDGEAKYYRIKGFKVAGKTGTAQIPLAGHYDPNKTIASFVGFAPADDPRFVMLVRYDQPSSSIYGSETAAPTFFSISKQLFPYLNIVPTQQ